MPEIVFIMGKSASGKDKIYSRLVEDNTLNLKTVVMYTTRPKRIGEKEGVQYRFVDNDTFLNMKKQEKIIESRSYNTQYGVWTYFTADDGQIDLKSGDKYIIIGTLEAYDQFCRYYGKEHILPIYIVVDDEIRLLRAIKREAKQEVPRFDEMCRRYLADELDFSVENINKLEITNTYSNNGALDDCVEEIRKTIIKNMF